MQQDHKYVDHVLQVHIIRLWDVRDVILVVRVLIKWRWELLHVNVVHLENMDYGHELIHPRLVPNVLVDNIILIVDVRDALHVVVGFIRRERVRGDVCVVQEGLMGERWVGRAWRLVGSVARGLIMLISDRGFVKSVVLELTSRNVAV